MDRLMPAVLIGAFLLCVVLVIVDLKLWRRSSFDHDGDGVVGGSLPAEERGLDDLVAEYRRLYGRKPDRRWGESTLRKKIAARLAGNE